MKIFVLTLFSLSEIIMGGGSGYSLPKKKSASGKPGTQNTDITVFAEEQFSGNSETFEASNSQFKTSFDLCFKEPVKSIIVAGLSLDILKSEKVSTFFSGNPWILYPEPAFGGRPTILEEGK